MADLRDAYSQRVAAIRAQVVRVITATWIGLPSYRSDDMARWVSRTVALALAAQRQTASLTDAYLSRLAGQASKGIDLASVTGEALRGVAPAVVYQRPAVAVYTALSNGDSFDQAKANGLDRAVQIVTMDLALSRTHAARANQQRRGVELFQRVLSGGRNCDLCIQATAERYHVGELSPIHPSCNCGVADLGPDQSPDVSTDELDASQSALPQGFVIRQHGEYGPLLAVAGQNFAQLGDIPN